jgi:D-glycero-D-manno-heptose 1,7-bisphosphate phosphatase
MIARSRPTLAHDERRATSTNLIRITSRVRLTARPTIQACAAAAVDWVVPGAEAPAVFLDRDGTLVLDRPYNGDPSQVELLPGTPAALRTLRQAGFRLIVVTNQSGLARGLFSVRDLQAVHARLDQLLAARGAWIDAYYYCPHHVDGIVQSFARGCQCRKPATGMLERAAAEWAIDLRQSWMIGDLPSDVEAGARSGCRVIQVGKRRVESVGRVIGLLDAAKLIVARAGSVSSTGRE